MPAWGYDPNGLVLPSLCDGRLSLSATEPVTTSDQQNKQTVYWHPFGGNRVALYNGSVWTVHTIASVKTVTVPVGVGPELRHLCLRRQWHARSRR